MTDVIKINELLDVEEKTIERGTIINPIDDQNQQDAYIKNLLQCRPIEIAKDEGSNNKTQDSRMPYCDPNFKSYCFNQQINQR